MSKQKNFYVISYDIASDKVRNKIASELKNYGNRVQYSVFECSISEVKYRELYRKLLAFCLEESTDSIRIYYICDSCKRKVRIIGNAMKQTEEEVFIV